LRNYTKILFFILLVAASFYSNAQIYNALNVTRKEGLSNSNVKAICVDHLGYVWFGTEHGLNRYNGFETVNYYNDINDKSTISNNNIVNIYEDDAGNIWVVTQSGLNRYNRKLDSFETIVLDNKQGNVQCFFEDDENVWLLNSYSSVSLYNKAKGIIQNESLKFKDVDSNIINYSIQKVCDFNQEFLLVAIPSAGLFLLHKTDKTLEPYFKLPIFSYTGLELIGDEVWVSSRFSGIFRIDKKNDTSIIYNVRNSDLKSTIILDFKKSLDTNHLWIATDGDGIQEFDSDFKLINHYISGPRANQPLPEDAIQLINFGEKGNVWLGTVRSGAVLLYPSDFGFFSFVNNNTAGPSNKVILRIFEDEAKDIWIGTDGGGLNKFNPASYSFTNFQENGIDKVTGIVPFSENVLLISVYLKQLYFFNTKTYKYSNAHLHPLLADIVLKKHYRIFRDSKNNIWILANKLWKINLENNTREVFPNSDNPQLFAQISASFFSVSEDSVSGKLWFGCGGGMYFYDYKKNRIQTPVVLNNLRNSYGSSVYSVLVDERSNVIFGTSRGLYIYNPESKLVSNYFEDDAFENTVFQTLFKVDKTLWAATSDGLLKITGHNSARDVIFYQAGNHEFRVGSIFKTADSYVYLGTNNGFIRFLPHLIEEKIAPKPVVITSFSRINTKSNTDIKQSVLADISDSTSTKIPFSNSVYQFNFNSFDIPFQDKISYSYSLEGFEEIWHTGKLRTATYTNLAPGEYNFVVKASTKNGIWNEQITQLKFEVLPAWWQTAWFRILVIGFILAISGLVWNELLKRAKLKHLVEVEKNERERLKEVNQMKLRFFTNISHELRTPLTLIYSPLKNLVFNNPSIDEIKERLPGLYRNAQRMKHLVDQILEFRKAEMDELRLNPERTDLIDFCRGVIDSFHFMAQSEGIKIKFSLAEESLIFDFDRDKFTKILYNLFSNALKHTPSNGVITLAVEKQGEWVNVSLTDTGKGIDESKLEDIFERYYQLENEVEGTGIGLALTKKLVNLHDGEIWAESKPGEGAVFHLKVPFVQKAASQLIEEVSKDKVDLPDFEQAIPKITNGDKSGLSLLIIEDDWELRHYLETEFKTEFNIYTAANGKIGLYEAIENLPDVVITDVMMPELNGYEFCKALHADLRISHIPVVMLTAKTMTENQIEGYKAGADLYVPKPFDTDILQSQIQALLANRELLKKRFGHDLGFNVKEITHSQADEKLLHKSISIVEMNMQNTQFDVNDFVDKLGISRTLAYKKIKAISGKSINDFILSVRLQKAGLLLKQSNKTISEIALEIGFSDHSYFSAVFKKNFEVSPSEFRQNEINS